MNSGDRLSAIIKIKSKTLSKFCADYGFSKSTVSNYTNGRNMDAEFLKALYFKLNVNPTWLLTGEGEMFINKNSNIINNGVIGGNNNTIYNLSPNEAELLDAVREKDSKKLLKLLVQFLSLLTAVSVIYFKCSGV